MEELDHILDQGVTEIKIKSAHGLMICIMKIEAFDSDQQLDCVKLGSQILKFFEKCLKQIKFWLTCGLLFWPEINKNHFNFLYVIGRGGFGKVWKVELRKEKKLYAMKEMAKARIISKRSVNSVMNEKKFLCQLQHP